MISTEIRQLTDHMEWADALVSGRLLEVPAAAEDARSRQLLYHVHAVQQAYHQLILGDAVNVPEVADFPDLPSVRDWGRDVHVALREMVATMAATDLDRTIEVPWTKYLMPGEVRHADARQALLQVTAHSTYHRGQLNTRIRELGREPVLADFVVWVWAGQPTADWSGNGSASG